MTNTLIAAAMLTAIILPIIILGIADRPQRKLPRPGGKLVRRTLPRPGGPLVKKW